MPIRYMLLAVAALSLGSPPAMAQTAPQPDPEPKTVAVLVEVPTPPGLPKVSVEAGMTKAVPQYRQVPGLLRKYFTIGDGNFGGMYLFTDRAAATAWFSDAWYARVLKTYGKPAKVSYFDVPIVLDNSAVK